MRGVGGVGGGGGRWGGTAGERKKRFSERLGLLCYCISTGDGNLMNDGALISIEISHTVTHSAREDCQRIVLIVTRCVCVCVRSSP